MRFVWRFCSTELPGTGCGLFGGIIMTLVDIIIVIIFAIFSVVLAKAIIDDEEDNDD